MAGMLSAIVIMFLCCHSSKIVVNFYEALQVTSEECSHQGFFRLGVCNRSLSDGSPRQEDDTSSVGDGHGENQSSPTHHQLRHKHHHLLLQGWIVLHVRFQTITLQDFKFRSVLLSIFKKEESSTAISDRRSYSSPRYKTR